jgi:hypothetical protein
MFFFSLPFVAFNCVTSQVETEDVEFWNLSLHPLGMVKHSCVTNYILLECNFAVNGAVPLRSHNRNFHIQIMSCVL